MLRFFCVPFELKIRPKQQLSTPRGKNSHIVRCIYWGKFQFRVIEIQKRIAKACEFGVYQKIRVREWWCSRERERESAMYFRKMNVCCSCRYDCLHKKILIFSLSVNKINKSFLSITDDSLVQPIHPSILTYSLVHHHFHPLTSYFFALAFVYLYLNGTA